MIQGWTAIMEVDGHKHKDEEYIMGETSVDWEEEIIRHIQANLNTPRLVYSLV
jgi:hypothetical protein